MAEILHDCVALSRLENPYAEFICTRGTSPDFSLDPRHAANRFIAFAIPFGSVANAVQMKRGLRVAITDVVRIPPPSVDQTIKNFHWLDLVKSLYAAYDQGAETAILVDTDGNIAEGPGFNVFMVKDARVTTPDSGILPGITRQTVFDLCEGFRIKCSAAAISPDELQAADEVFITSTAGGVMPVTNVNGKPIGSGDVGFLTSQITDGYWRLHVDDKQRLIVQYQTGDNS